MNMVALIDTLCGEDEMKSCIPKALTPLCGRAMYLYAVDAVKAAGVARCVIVGKVEEETSYDTIAQAIAAEKADAYVYVRADMPFITGDCLSEMLSYAESCDSDAAALYGMDESGDEFFADVAFVKKGCLAENPEITAAVKAAQAKDSLSKLYTESDEDTFTVCDKCDLAAAESLMRNLINEGFMLEGVTMIDPTTTYIAADAQFGQDVVIYPNVIIQSGVKIGNGVMIGSNSNLSQATIGDQCNIMSSVIMDSEIKSGTRVGPFAYIRPNCSIGPNAKIGDFVEVKNSTIGEKTSVAHLTYIGDSDVGSYINFGCGCVTVNYDGKNKFRCKIGDHSFVGCNTNLVAPVTVGKGSYIAAGSTITDEVPEDALAIARARQVNKTGWKDKRK